MDKRSFKTILLSGFIAGTLDMLSAILVYSAILHKTSALKIMQSIASGVLGKQAYAGEITTALYGLALHYSIAFIFAIGYFFLFPRVVCMRKHKIASGVLYGICIGALMNLVVLPLVFSQRAAITWDSFLLAVTILILMIGLPVSFITHKHYTSKHNLT